MHTTQSERSKYEKIWAMPEYSIRSPGLRHLPDALGWMKPEPRSSITDWGSGSGQASDKLHSLEFKVRMIDIAPNAYKGELPVIEACLWELPDDLGPTDYGICCDVMEHLPTERIDDVFAGIAKRTTKAVYFQIALFDDTTYTHAGPLHLSVFPPDWWQDKIRQNFSGAEFKMVKMKHLLAVCVP